jgi:hypothetical protein
MEGKEWYIRQRIWALTGYQKEDAICQANRMQVDYLSHKTQEPQGQVLFVFSLVTFSSRWSLVILFLVNSHLGLIFKQLQCHL